MDAAFSPNLQQYAVDLLDVNNARQSEDNIHVARISDILLELPPHLQTGSSNGGAASHRHHHEHDEYDVTTSSQQELQQSQDERAKRLQEKEEISRQKRLQNAQANSAHQPQPIRALFFGLDSLIANIHDLNYRCWNFVLHNYGYDLTFEEYQRWLLMTSPHKVLQGLLPYSTIQEHQVILKDKEDRFIELVNKNQSLIRDDDRNKLLLVRGIRQFLSEVPDDGSIIKALVVDVSVREAKALLEALNLQCDVFDVLISSYNMRQPKPFPLVYETALRACKLDQTAGLKENAVFVFEGQPAGVCSAKYAGIKNIVGFKMHKNGPQWLSDEDKMHYKVLAMQKQQQTDASAATSSSSASSEANSSSSAAATQTPGGTHVPDYLRGTMKDETMEMVREGAKVVLDSFENLKFEHLLYM